VPQAEIDRVVKARLSRWQRHPDWEDIYQEGRIAAWQAVQGRRDPDHWKALADRAAGFALAGFLRSPANRERKFGKQGQPVAEMLPLSSELPAPDFAPGVIERLAFEEWRDRLTVPQRQVVDLHLREGLTLQETARRLSISRNTAKERLYWALRK